MLSLFKTLPHLIHLHLAVGGAGLYATAYSPQIERYLANARRLRHSELTYPELKAFFAAAPDSWKLVDTVTDLLQYSVKGDTVSFWPLGYSHPVRAQFFDQLPERLFEYDELYGRRLHDLEWIYIGADAPPDLSDRAAIVVDHIQPDADRRVIFTTFVSPTAQSGRLELVEFDFSYPPLMWSRLDLLQKELERLHELGYEIKLQTKHWNSITDAVKELLTREPSSPFLSEVPSEMPAGFISKRLQAALFTDREIFGTIYLSKQAIESSSSSRLLRQFEGEISVRDFVVHEDYGVAVYAGLTQEIVGGIMQDYLELEYAGEDKLLVPVAQIGKLTRYIGPEGVAPKLSRLGKNDWENARQKAGKSVTILAKELIQHYALREMSKAPVAESGDSKDYEKFVGDFPYTETDDQLRAVNEVLADIQSEMPMNRLLIGDVGFGKTEVIMRAAFKVAESGLQVAVLVPTTVLASQHYAVFSERFKDTGFKVESMSRFNTTKENQDIADRINAGKVDIIIGTHRILGNDIKFHKLGLLVVDEEQRFGVGQKEKIKKLNYGVHYLSVSATPIPRTLGMAMSSIQDISILAAAPRGRKPIHTELLKNDWNKVRDAIAFEIERGGQIYFVHNEVQSINSIKDRVEKLMPGVRITVGHGQMPPGKLDGVMSDFYRHKYDILLSTTIIENGLDLPNVNTMIVNQAHKFGLSQLYQLRGRVGRSERQAFCFLFYEGRKLRSETEEEDEKKLVEKDYVKRLQALVDASELGSGFQIASRDLEIRGAGNLLGEKQSGHISSVGYALYMQLLSQEIERMKALSDRQLPEIVSF